MNEETESKGPLVGIVVVIAILVLGAAYFLSQRGDNANSENTLPELGSDEVAALEADLANLSDLESLEADLETIDLDATIEVDATVPEIPQAPAAQ